MWRIGGHLGSSVSALVDGQLDPETAERAWEHVMTCPPCRRLVEREGWVKRQLAEMAGATATAPPADLVGSLYELDPETREAWAAVEHLEDRARGRRRAGLAAVGVGSVSAAVLGLSTLSGAPLGIGGAPPGPPATSLTRPTPTTGPASTPTGSPSPSVGSFNGWVVRSPDVDGSATVPVRSSR
jgi:anti-sigma factor RsiW